MSRDYGYGQSQAQEPVVWERVEWRQGDGRYVFEVARGGLLAKLSAPHGSELTLPMVAWEGLLDALAAARKTKTRTERNLPSRTGARWSEVETQELVKTFKAGGSIAQLARVHNRTQFAVEAQLERQGLWDRAERRPTARLVGAQPPPGAPAAYPSGPTALPSGVVATPSGPAPVDDRRYRPVQPPLPERTDAQQLLAPAPAAGRRPRTGHPVQPGVLDARGPGPAAPIDDRRDGPAQQRASGAMEEHRRRYGEPNLR
jgi:hypothetical protein